MKISRGKRIPSFPMTWISNIVSNQTIVPLITNTLVNFNNATKAV